MVPVVKASVCVCVCSCDWEQPSQSGEHHGSSITHSTGTAHSPRLQMFCIHKSKQTPHPASCARTAAGVRLKTLKYNVHRPQRDVTGRIKSDWKGCHRPAEAGLQFGRHATCRGGSFLKLIPPEKTKTKQRHFSTPIAARHTDNFGLVDTESLALHRTARAAGTFDTVKRSGIHVDPRAAFTKRRRRPER